MLQLNILPRAEPSGVAEGGLKLSRLLTDAIAASRTLTGRPSTPILRTGGLWPA